MSCAGSDADSKRALPLGVRRAFSLPNDLKALSESDFESLSRIVPKLTRRIVEERKRRGGFDSIEDLREVEGIGPFRWATVRSALNPSEPQSVPSLSSGCCRRLPSFPE